MSIIPPQFRTGIGYDVHPLIDGQPLIIGGVQIEHEKGLSGHSDADVLAHAICDALIGAIGGGDIGQWFPDTDPEYKNADSLELLKTVSEELIKQGWDICNIDCTVMAEQPKLAPSIPQMLRNVATALGIPETLVNVKATRGEGLGFIGRCEGIAALAIALIQKVDH